MDRLTGVSQLSVTEICAPRCLAVRRDRRHVCCRSPVRINLGAYYSTAPNREK